MRTANSVLILVLFIVTFTLTLEDSKKVTDPKNYGENESTGSKQFESEKKGEVTISSHEIEKRFFAEWNHPYSDGIPSEIQLNIQKSIKSLPGEEELDPNSTNSWQQLGPNGIPYPDSTSIKYSGRVKDIEAPSGNVELRVGASSGGIWRHMGTYGVCVSNSLPSPWLGSFTTDPANSNIVYAGTGEPDVMGGIGLWKTTDAGASWQQVNFANDVPWCFYKIRFDPNIAGRIHAATSDGYFRSDNNGSTWINKYPGLVSDFAINTFNNSSVVYIAEKNSGTGGILKSTNGGDSFTRITNLPHTDIGMSLIATGNSQNTVYVFLGQNSTGLPIGVYRSDNSGTSWTTITPQGVQAFNTARVEYKSLLSVCPADPNTVMTGTTSMCRSTNGGLTWTEYWDIGNNPYRNLHGDHHRMEWKDANTVYSANDGGIAVSTDKGATWSSAINILPITQFYDFDIGTSNKNVMYGGTQDNGTVKTENLGNTWYFIDGGDGAGNDIDPLSSNTVYITHNASGNITYRRYKTIDGGQTWIDITSNLPPLDDWVPKIHSDKTTPFYLYTNGGSHMFKSTNEGVNWTQMNSTAFPTPYILNFSVSIYSGTGPVIYACLEDAPESGNHTGKLLRVYDNGTWYERSAGLPTTGAWVRNVAIHPTDINTAYALMNGFSGSKVFKTTNRGVNWTNITGNLPDIPVSDLVPHPSDNNKLYLSSEFGCYKTTNGGTNWYRWNNGMPGYPPLQSSDPIICDLKVIDSIAQNGKYYIAACTYGRGIWMREISGDDPIGIISNSTPVAYSLSQNYPNPFNPSTKIDFSIAKSMSVRIIIYDVLGRAVRTLLDEKRQAGSYSVEFDAKNLSSGVYFYKLTSGDYADVKKMVIIK